MSYIRYPAGDGGGSGNVVGPGGSTDNAITRWNGTAGTHIQNSTAELDDAGNLSAKAFYGNDGDLSIGLGGTPRWEIPNFSNSILRVPALETSGTPDEAIFAGAENDGSGPGGSFRIVAGEGSGGGAGGNLTLQAGTGASDGVITIGSEGNATPVVLNTPEAAPAAGVLTMTNAPTGVSGNPAIYLRLVINGVTYVLPAWTA